LSAFIPPTLPAFSASCHHLQASDPKSSLHYQTLLSFSLPFTSHPSITGFDHLQSYGEIITSFTRSTTRYDRRVVVCSWQDIFGFLCLWTAVSRIFHRSSFLNDTLYTYATWAGVARDKFTKKSCNRAKENSRRHYLTRANLFITWLVRKAPKHKNIVLCMYPSLTCSATQIDDLAELP
jgi:hypothetical protein